MTNDESSDTRLADRVATIECVPAAKRAPVEGVSTSIKPSQGHTIGPSVPSSSASTHAEALARLRQDLGEAQRTKAEQQSRLRVLTEELEKLRTKSTRDIKRITELLTEKASNAVRMRDRDEELRGKSKLLEACCSRPVFIHLN